MDAPEKPSPFERIAIALPSTGSSSLPALISAKFWQAVDSVATGDNLPRKTESHN
jgi:hypothetical protein